MDVRAQIATLFHLDKCIGCHTCSISCKNIWTDRKGTEYMWWNNVETKPGTGYPSLWEDQDKYRGGWELKNEKDLKLRSTDKLRGFTNIFHQPFLPTIDDYYEPWTYKFNDLFDSPAMDDQPTAIPISQITGKPMDIEAGPNWDDDLSGSTIYAANDPDFADLSEAERQAFFETERMMFFYLPRICNHCLNPSCVASCPSGALYKRGEDGIVLVNQNKCRAWRFCVSACPYKKVYYNWKSGKSEKCILCYPRLETGQAPACFHSCVGRIRYLGVLLYDMSQLPAAAKVDDTELVDAQRAMIQDPFDPEVIASAKSNGVTDSIIEAAQKSPVYRFVIDWNLALPLHPEFRTFPTLFYVPPLLPVLANIKNGNYEIDAAEYFGALDKARVPMKYLARLFSAGNEEPIRGAYEKLLAVRIFKRIQEVGDLDKDQLASILNNAGLTVEDCEDIYRLTSLSTFDERFVIPPSHREQAIELIQDPQAFKAETGIGFKDKPGQGK